MGDVVMYCRVSTEEQVTKQLSIPSQQQALSLWAGEQGYRVAESFVDEGYSAFVSATKRPAFQALVAYCLRHRPFAVVVWSYDRFARNRMDAVVYKELLRKHEVRVISLTEPVEDSHSGRLQEGILELLAEFYSAQIGFNTRRGLKARADLGLWVGGKVPFGYALGKVLHQGVERSTLVMGPDDQVASIRYIYSLSSERHWGGTRIARQLNAECRRAPGVRWTADTVVGVLRQPLYAGLLRKGEGVIPTPLVPVIVQRDEWERVQAGLQRRRPGETQQVASVYLLTGLLWCECGNRCYATWNHSGKGRLYYYICSSRTTGGQCSRGGVRMEQVDGVVIKALGPLMTEEMIKTLGEELEKTYMELRDGPDRPSSQERTANLKRRISRLYEAIEEGGDVRVLTKRIVELQGELHQLDLEQAQTSERRQRLENARENIQVQLKRLQNTRLLDLPHEVQRELVLALVERVELRAEGLHVVTRFAGDGPEVCGVNVP